MCSVSFFSKIFAPRPRKDQGLRARCKELIFLDGPFISKILIPDVTISMGHPVYVPMFFKWLDQVFKLICKRIQTLHTAVSAVKKHIAGFPLHLSPTGYTAQKAIFTLFLSPNLIHNMGDLCKILIQNCCRFRTHSTTISSLLKEFLLMFSFQ